MTNATDNRTILNIEHGHAVITYLFKHGGEAAHIILFDSDEAYERFDFDRWFMDSLTHESGMFPLNGYERVSIDTMARIHCELFDKEDF